MRAELALGAGGLGQYLFGQRRCELVGGEVVGKARPLLASLEIWPVAPYPHDDVGSWYRDRVDVAGVDALKMIGHECMETSVAIAEVEASEPGDPLLVSGCDPVEIVLEPCGEVVVDQLVEVPFEKLRHREGNERRHERGSLLVDVAAVDGMVPMIEAYVDGRPIPRSSSARTRLASV